MQRHFSIDRSFTAPLPEDAPWPYGPGYYQFRMQKHATNSANLYIDCREVKFFYACRACFVSIKSPNDDNQFITNTEVTG